MMRHSIWVPGLCLCLCFVTLSLSGDSPPEDLAVIQEEHASRAEEARRIGARAGLDEPGFGLQEVFRKSFQPPLRVGNGLKALPGTPYALAYSELGHLFVVNPSQGTILNWEYFGRNGFGEAAGGEGDRRRLILPTSTRYGSSKSTLILDVTDPLNIEEIEAEEPCGMNAVVLPGATLGVTFGDSRKTCLLDLDTGAIVYQFGHTTHSGIGVRSGGATAWLRNLHISYPQSIDRFELYALNDPEHPTLRYSFEAAPYSRFVAESDQEILVVLDDAGFQVRDLASGAPISTHEWANSYSVPYLVHNGPGMMLAIMSRDSMDLFDLTDPANPRFARSVPVKPLYSRSIPSGKPHPTEPWIAVSTSEPGGVVVIDVRDGSEMLRHEVEGAGTGLREWMELPSGEQALLYFGEFITWKWPSARPEGGRAVIDAIPIDSVQTDPRFVRTSNTAPDRIPFALPLGGRWVGIADMGNNAILLVDSADGSVVDRLGYDQRLPSSDLYYKAAAAEKTMIVASGFGYNVFRLVDGKLERTVSRALDYQQYNYVRSVAVRPDGTAVVVGGGWLWTHTPDGRTGFLELASSHSSMELSRSGDRGVISAGSVWGGPSSVAEMVDLSDPANPRTLWVSDGGVEFANFVREDQAIAVTIWDGQSWGFSPLLLDIDTGEPLGDPGDPTAPFIYYGPSCAFGGGEDASLLYWRWTWRGWKSVIYNVSGNTPRVFPESEEYFDLPECVPRADGKAAYEFRQWPKNPVTEVALGLPDGSFIPYGGTTVYSPRRLRHGFLVGRATTPAYHDEELVIVRDPAMNRRPFASVPAQVSECDDSAGTEVFLDGAGSSDPDSTPGTNDDIAGYTWAVDGQPAGDGETVEASLALGSHTAGLTVTDVLGQSGANEAVVHIEDTLPPELNLALEPVLRPGPVWAHEWQVTATATDLCDGELIPDVQVAAVLEGEHSYVPAETNRIEVRSGRKGTELLLYGPDPVFLESVLESARVAGGLAVEPDALLELVTLPSPPRGVHRDTVAVYRLDEAGILVGASAYGEAADFRVISRAGDRSGHRAEQSLSLQEVRGGYRP